MESITARPFKSSRVALVVEVLVPISRQDSWVQVTTSIPGREGTKTKTWMLEPSGADSRTVEDLVAYVGNQVIVGLALISGVHMTLPEV